MSASRFGRSTSRDSANERTASLNSAISTTMRSCRAAAGASVSVTPSSSTVSPTPTLRAPSSPETSTRNRASPSRTSAIDCSGARRETRTSLNSSARVARRGTTTSSCRSSESTTPSARVRLRSSSISVSISLPVDSDLRMSSTATFERSSSIRIEAAASYTGRA